MKNTSTKLIAQEYVVNFAIKNSLHFDNKTVLIGVQHLLEDTYFMYLDLIKLNLLPKNIFTLGKPYSTIPIISNKLCKVGVNIIKNRQSKIGKYYDSINQDITQLWEAVSNHLKNYPEISKLLLLDDGGLLLKSIPQEISCKCSVAGVEQTTSGLNVLKDNHLPFPLILCASSAAKLIFEPNIIVKAALNKALPKIEKISRKKINRLSVGIIGLGTMGSALAKHIKNHFQKVYIYDFDPSKYASFTFENVSIANSVQDLASKSDIIFGCTGKNVFSNGEVIIFKNNQIFISVSTGDIEFLYLLQKSKKLKNKILKDGTIMATVDDKNIYILQNGFPINFDNVSGSGEPTQMQLTTSLLIASLIQANYLLRNDTLVPINYMLDSNFQNEIIRHLSVQSPDMIFSNERVSDKYFKLNSSESFERLSMGFIDKVFKKITEVNHIS